MAGPKTDDQQSETTLTVDLFMLIFFLLSLNTALPDSLGNKCA